MIKNPILMIVNPIAGRGELDQRVAAVARRLKSAECAVRIARTEAAGDATKMARAASDATKVVLAVGGDGTVREVVMPPMLGWCRKRCWTTVCWTFASCPARREGDCCSFHWTC